MAAVMPKMAPEAPTLTPSLIRELSRMPPMLQVAMSVYAVPGEQINDGGAPEPEEAFDDASDYKLRENVDRDVHEVAV